MVVIPICPELFTLGSSYTLCSVSLSSFAPVSGVGVDFVCTGIDTGMVVPLCVSCTLSMLGHEYVFDTDCNSVLSRHLDLRFLIYLLF